MLSKEKFAYHPMKSPTGDNFHRLEKIRRFKSKSLFFLVFLLLITYIVLNILLPDSIASFSFSGRTGFEKTNSIDVINTTVEFETELPVYVPKKNATEEPKTEFVTLGSTTLTNVITTTTDTHRSGKKRTLISRKESTLEQMACLIPKLNPMDPAIKYLIKDPDPVNCAAKFPLLFQSYPNSTIIPLTNAILSKGFKACCYRTVTRKSSNKNPDDGFRRSSTCYPLSIYNATNIDDPDHEFLAIYCKNMSAYEIMDMHAFVHLKSSVEDRVNKYYEKLKAPSLQVNTSNNITIRENSNISPENERVNVLMLGIDAVSHMNFLRSMPKSYKYLMNNLSAVEMQGLNKIGDNTLPNMAAVLTSLNLTEISACQHKKVYDKCPFIWKEYAAQGYRTLFGEDATWMGMFNYLQRGFEKPPTDYYLRPYGEAADELIGTNKKLNANLCHGPRFSFQGLMDYTQKTAYRMGHEKRYMQLTWTTALTHDYLNYGHFGDEFLISTLDWLNQRGDFNKTVLILMSDHGIRWGEIRDHLQGQLEERLPFLYFVLPTWFKVKYLRAYQNLLKNQNRLTTPYDIYYTLKDLLDPSSLETNTLMRRELILKNLISQEKPPRGISQFLPIPASRNCEMASVPDHYCTCHRSQEISNEHPLAVQAANYVVYFINLMISKYTECAYLALETVKSVAVVSSGLDKAWKSFTVVLKTRPGAAMFEASIEKDKHGFWKVSGTISRTNLYGNQSHCVSEKDMKLYCYCLDMMKNKSSVS